MLAPRLQMTVEEKELWKKLENLEADECLPDGLPQFFYSNFASYLKSGCYADRIEPFLQHFPREK